MNNREIAKEFWTTHEKYPDYGTIKQRRIHELNYLIPWLTDVNSLLDLGCGDGALIKCLNETTDIKEFYAFDISEKMMINIPAKTRYYDCYDPKDLPKTDFTVFSGVIPYLFEDEIVKTNLEKINSDLVYIKSPCSLSDKDIEVNTYSDQLKSNYSSLYRTIPNMIRLIQNHFDIIEINKIYPESIESKFGTKQISFICKKR